MKLYRGLIFYILTPPPPCQWKTRGVKIKYGKKKEGGEIKKFKRILAVIFYDLLYPQKVSRGGKKICLTRIVINR